MQSYTELQTELQARLMVATNSTLYTTARVQTLIKDAHLWATSSYMWPQLEKAMITHTITDHYYYDYPADFRTDAICRVYIDSKRYERKAFEDFLNYRDTYPTETDTEIFADYGRQIFIFPTPTTTGTSNFDVWGCIQATQLSAGTDETIFSNHDDSGNEAIVKKALSVAIAKVNKEMSMQEEAEAKAMLAVIWDKIAKRQQRDQRIDHPQYDVPDFFSGSQSTPTGGFNYQP